MNSSGNILVDAFLLGFTAGDKTAEMIKGEDSTSQSTDGDPVTNDNDEELQAEVEGEYTEDEAGDRKINIDGETWDGMESGAVAPGKGKSTQEHDWLKTVDPAYLDKAKQWAANRGVIKITPIEQRQKFTYSTVAYIADKQEEPKTQIVPISDLQVTPHQITWDFYDTTEGRVGVSNAVEKHMICEFDVYISEIVASYWAFGEDNQYNYAMDMQDVIKAAWDEAWATGSYMLPGNVIFNIEETKWFVDFRNSFLQQHMGWVCRFSSHAFGVFQGVINEVNFTIGSGETSSKFHVKIEEAVFLKGAYSTKGKKEDSTTSEDGSQTDSGDAGNDENVATE